MKYRILKFFIIVCLTSGALPSVLHARVVDKLTSARVPVADRSDIEFARATSKALELVLVKLTGDSRTPKSTQGRSVLSKAQRLVQQFGYEKSASSGGAAEANLLLRVEFDPEVLSSEMRQAGLVLWGKERPETRVFIVVRGAGSATVVSNQRTSDENAAEIQSIVARQATNRGIPISFPEPAVAAQINVGGSAAEILAHASELEQANRVDGVAVAIFEGSPLGLWEAQWLFRVANEQESFANEGDLVALLAEEATDSLADVIGSRYANPALLGRNESVQLQVTGIYDGTDFARVATYLKSLDGVEQLFVHRAQNDRISLSAVVQGGYAGLAQSIAFGRLLEPVDSSPGEFRLVGR
ncbi:MAG: DUF2066 domain-containing protein [Pseudomonadota bacterium]